MKFTQLLRTAAVAAAAVFTFGTAQAQSPDGQLGLGITTGSQLGGTISYAINPAFHLGTIVGFEAANNVNTIVLAPYGRFLFAGPNPFLKPFIQAQFSLLKVGDAEATTAIGVGGGAEYFVNRNLGIYAGLTIFNLGLSPSGNTFGLLSPQIGVEWFL